MKNAIIQSPVVAASFSIVDDHLSASITQPAAPPIPMYLPAGKRFTVSRVNGSIVLAFEDVVEHVDKPVGADPPACVDCVHLCIELCTNEACKAFHPVNGRHVIDAAKARAANGPCGPEAREFKARRKPNVLERNWFLLFVLCGAIAIAAIQYKFGG